MGWNDHIELDLEIDEMTAQMIRDDEIEGILQDRGEI